MHNTLKRSKLPSRLKTLIQELIDISEGHGWDKAQGTGDDAAHSAVEQDKAVSDLINYLNRRNHREHRRA